MASARQLCNLIAPDVRLPIATLAFTDLETVVADGFFAQSLVIEDLEKSYDEFVQQYEPLTTGALKGTSVEAFVIRTMLVHDLRRIRLRGPDVPTALLPADWRGHTAEAVAASLYGELTYKASAALSEILDTEYPQSFVDRFPPT